MLTLLARLLISRSIDDGRRPPRWVARRSARSPELRRFAASAARIDRALSATPPPLEEPSPFLAGRIRAAVDAAPTMERERAWSPRVLVPAALGTVALAGVFVAVRLAQEPPPAARGPIGITPSEVFGRIPSASSLAASIEKPIKDEARQLWDGTRRAGVIVLARVMPSTPTLPR